MPICSYNNEEQCIYMHTPFSCVYATSSHLARHKHHQLIVSEVSVVIRAFRQLQLGCLMSTLRAINSGADSQGGKKGVLPLMPTRLPSLWVPCSLHNPHLYGWYHGASATRRTIKATESKSCLHYTVAAWRSSSPVGCLQGWTPPLAYISHETS